MGFVAEEGNQFRSDCSTLILPALSIGNVGQLAVDFLISSIGAEKIGFLDDPNVLPCVGNDAYGPVPQGELALPLEAYELAPSKLCFVQQKSPVVKVPYHLSAKCALYNIILCCRNLTSGMRYLLKASMDRFQDLGLTTDRGK